MPRGDRTGPRGQGPGTGRGLGACTGFSHPGSPRGRGGYGHRHMFYATGLPGWMRWNESSPNHPAYGPEQEKKVLEDEARELRQHLNYIEERLQQLENKDEE